MARILFFPLFLIILSLAVFLVLRIRSMFTLSKSRDIVLSGSSPYRGDILDLADAMVKSLEDLDRIEYKSEIHVNYKKVEAFSRTCPGPGYSKITGGQAIVEFSRGNGSITARANRDDQKQISRENPWVDFWCGTSSMEESLGLFRGSGLKVMAGSTGAYLQRNYTEIIILSPSLPAPANEAFEVCTPFLSRVYGKNLSDPGARIRNFMIRIMVNSLTSLPDFVEVKYNVFREDQFVYDFLQNSRLMY